MLSQNQARVNSSGSGLHPEGLQAEYIYIKTSQNPLSEYVSLEYCHLVKHEGELYRLLNMQAHIKISIKSISSAFTYFFMHRSETVKQMCCAEHTD